MECVSGLVGFVVGAGAQRLLRAATGNRIALERAGGLLQLKYVVACIIGFLTFSISAVASTLSVNPMVLPMELRGLSVSSVVVHRDQIVVAGVNDGGACTVALLDLQLVVRTMRSFPGAVGDSCEVAAIDSVGNLLLFGVASAPGFPRTSNLFQPDGGNFVLKLSRSSLAVIFSVRFGLGRLQALALARDDSMWLGGYITVGLPTTPDAVQREYPRPFSASRRDRTGFLIRLTPDGQTILYSTYLGGTTDAVGTISIDDHGNIYAAGSQIWKFSPASRLLWSTWLPWSSTMGSAVGLDGDLYLVGTTGTFDHYTTPLAFQTTPFTPQSIFRAGDSAYYPSTIIDGFVARFSPTGDLVYSTLLGGIGQDILTHVIPSPDGSAFVYGSASGRLFPTHSPLSMGPLFGGAVSAKLTASGTAVSFATYLSGGRPRIARHPSGGYVVFTRADGYHPEAGVYRLTEEPASLPRVDSVFPTTRPRDNLSAGVSATIAGEGFEVVDAVFVGDQTAKILAQSGSEIQIEIPLNLPRTGNDFGFTGPMSLLADGRVLRSIQISAFVRSPAQP